VLRVEGLRKSYGDTEAVAGLSFDVRAGEVFGLLVPNGAGKTTTLSILATEKRASGGSASVLGRDLTGESVTVRKSIGVAPQQIALYPMLTAIENLQFFGRMYGVSGVRLRSRIEELLQLVELEAHANHYVVTFSGGMKRRLNLAVALVHAPKLILPYEPTAGVDVHSRERIFEIVRGLRNTGTTVVFTTHYTEEAEGLCDRIGIVNRGKLVAMGRLDELLSDMDYRDVIELRGAGDDVDLSAIRSARGLCRIERGGGVVRLFVRKAASFLAPLQRIISRSERPINLRIARIGLAHLFLHLTGRQGAARLMCHLRLRLIASLAVIAYMFFSVPAFAGDPLDNTRGTLEQARAVVASDRIHNDKLASLSALFSRFLDTDTMGREALGRHWSEFTSPQQKEFLALFAELLERTYVQNLLLFDNPKFQCVSETESNGVARVDRTAKDRLVLGQRFGN
jgi:linearmycin/streptolysin S transport system ATP-binding protein